MADIPEGLSSQRRLCLADVGITRVEDLRRLLKAHHSFVVIDLTGLDTSQVESMTSLSRANEAQVWNMIAMFKGCSSLVAVDLSCFDTSRVTTLAALFEGCESLREVDLSHLDTRAVIRMEEAFMGCRSLESVNLSRAFCSMFERTDPANYQIIRPTQDVFTGCTSIKRWKVSDSWMVKYRGSVPEPTNEYGARWSELAGAWMTPEQIRQRGMAANSFRI